LSVFLTPDICHAARVGQLVFVSGQGPIDPKTKFVLGSTAEQTRLIIENMRVILEGCGGNLQDVVKCTVYLTDGNDFAVMNAVYSEYFAKHPPTRTTIVSALVVPGMKVEIDCIASLEKGAAS
jgi:2-iminobutanoate/2-iminopropanoate deaminase